MADDSTHTQATDDEDEYSDEFRVGTTKKKTRAKPLSLTKSVAGGGARSPRVGTFGGAKP